jgi:hypothetical protein
MKHFAMIVLALVLLGGPLGCSQPAPGVSARMDDAEVRSVLSAHCPAGATQAQVASGLDSLNVRSGSRIAYTADAGRGPVLLVRLFEDRGPWLDSGDSDIKFLDVSFAFSKEDHLERTLLFRDRIRYVQGEPITSPGSPKRALKGPLQPYPHPIPPPVDPLEGAS